MAIVIFLARGTLWEVPSDFSERNTIECIGGGAGGGFFAGGGGGGGEHSVIANLSLKPGALISYAIGIGGAPGSNSGSPNGRDGTPTYFNGVTLEDASVGSAGGAGGIGSGGVGGAGGSSGGSPGGAGSQSPDGFAGGGGGGAAGPNGAGTTATTQAGGSGDNGFGGIGGLASLWLTTEGGVPILTESSSDILIEGVSPARVGGNGTEYDASHGSGGGGAGGNGSGGAISGAAGGIYGAGGGGGGTHLGFGTVGGAGTGGLIVITYEPGPLPLQDIIPAYPYQEYADDPNIVAFFTALNEIAQSYLDWFNQTPLAVYTSPNISGALLDWIATGIYGIERPVFSSQTTKYVAGLNSLPLNSTALNGHEFFQSGTATIATDDYYKRVLTWWLYAGNGRYFNVELLRLKVARFLFGVGGTDVTLTQAEAVHIQPQTLASPPAPTLTSTSGGTIAARKYGAQITYVTALGETLPSAPSSLTVLINHLLIVDSPPPESGAVAYDSYVNILSTNPGKFIAGLNSMPVNGCAVDGTNKAPVSPPTRQNLAPIPIGTNWTEPTSGLIVGAALPSQNTSNTPGNYIIVVPPGTASQYLKQALGQGLLAFPFQLSFSVVITS